MLRPSVLVGFGKLVMYISLAIMLVCFGIASLALGRAFETTFTGCP